VASWQKGGSRGVVVEEEVGMQRNNLVIAIHSTSNDSAESKSSEVGLIRLGVTSEP